MSSSNTPRKRLVVIDGKSVFYRGYYAMPNLSTKDGTPTGGVYGFAVLALEVIKQLKPDYVAVAWDKPKTNIRKRLEMYPEYKAGRKPPPADFYEQIPILHELLQAFGWPLYELDDYEADDIMGTLALQAGEKDIETILVTSDLDMLQLVNDLTHVYALKKGLSNIEHYSPEFFTEKYGIRTDQFLDLKSLKGDSSDNVPGVVGIGEKGAIELLQKYDTLDGVYDNLHELRDTLRTKLEKGKDMAYLSKQVMGIWTDAPLPLNLDEVDGSKANPAKIHELLVQYEFRTLARQLPDIMKVSDGQQGLALESGPDLSLPKIQQINDAALAKLDFSKADEVIVFSRSAGAHGHDPRLIFVSDSADTLYALKVPELDTTSLRKVLNTIKGVSGYDVKGTLKVFIELGLAALPPVKHDALIAAFLINSLRREQSITELAQSELGYSGSDLDNLSEDELLDQAPTIAAVLRTLHEQQVAALKAMPKLPALAEEVEWPVIPVLARMEYRGMQLDTDYLQKFSEEVAATIADVEKQIYELAGTEFNIGSPSQLADVLFEKMQLPSKGIKKGKTGFSTAASELDKLRGQHPIIDLITQYREVTKLKNTYIDTLPTMVDKDCRIHTTFNLTIAQTGRLSSINPNLQNIPVRTGLGRRIRTAFTASPGHKLVSADYSQFELRLAAAMSNDERMIKLFNDDADIHTVTAAEIQGRKPEDVTKQMRSAAKTVNFGVLYGMSPHGLSAATGMTFEQSKHFIDEYFKLRGPLLAYMNGLKESARKEGYVETLHGRRRPMPDIHSSNFMVRQGAERAAMNMPIQGTEADLMKIAMVNVQNALDKQFPDTQMLLQVHDSIMVEAPTKDAPEVAKLLKSIMEEVYPSLSVKLTVDTGTGDDWGAL